MPVVWIIEGEADARKPKFFSQVRIGNGVETPLMGKMMPQTE
jgi:hypothetical protein